MFLHYFVNYFVRLRTNHYTLLTISPISFIFDSTRNLPCHPLWCFMKTPITSWEWRNARWEKWLARRFTKCHLYTYRFSRFANIFSHSRQFDDKCIAGFTISLKFLYPFITIYSKLVKFTWIFFQNFYSKIFINFTNWTKNLHQISMNFSKIFKGFTKCFQNL